MRVKNFFLAGLIVALMSICSAGQAHVLDGAKEWNGHYYKIFEMPMNWEGANVFCKSMGGHLATAETQAENEMMKQIFKAADIQNCWLGAKRDNQNIWRWITGKMISDYFDWATDSEPKKDARFSVFHMSRDYKGRWYTMVPDYEYSFMCEWESAANAHESNM